MIFAEIYVKTFFNQKKKRIILFFQAFLPEK